MCGSSVGKPSWSALIQSCEGLHWILCVEPDASDDLMSAASYQLTVASSWMPQQANLWAVLLQFLLQETVCVPWLPSRVTWKMENPFLPKSHLCYYSNRRQSIPVSWLSWQLICRIVQCSSCVWHCSIMSSRTIRTATDWRAMIESLRKVAHVLMMPWDGLSFT